MSQTIHRSDYRAPTHLLEDIQLEFDLNAEETLVTSTFTARPNPESKDSSGELHLNGESSFLVTNSSKWTPTVSSFRASTARKP